MNRVKKLLINVSVIMVILYGFYYFGGYYISKEQCVTETLRSLYGQEKDVIMELENNNTILTLVADVKEKTFSLVGTKKIGFLYRTNSSHVGQKIREENCISPSGFYSQDSGMVIFVYRNDKRVNKVEVVFNNGYTFVLDEWQNDFAGVAIDIDEWQQGIYIAYDKNNCLIEEMNY